MGTAQMMVSFGVLRETIPMCLLIPTVLLCRPLAQPTQS